MSINVYLKGDEVKNLEGFTTKKKQGGKPVQEWDEHELSGVKLSLDKGRWYIYLSEPTEPIPAVVKDIVEEISFHGYLKAGIRREMGIYRHESAEAEIDAESAGGKPMYVVRIKAKRMENLLELFHKIKIGSIRPEESYEGQQNGMSRAELEAELERMRQSVSAFESLKANLYTFYQELEKGGWPFCTKKMTGYRIYTIFKNCRA